MVYKTSFNGLEVETLGVYKAYNLTPQEVESLRIRFHNKINGSGSNYAVYCNAKRYLWLKLFVHDVWIPIKLDIRKDFLAFSKADRIFEKDIRKASKELMEMRLELHVDYDLRTNSWTLVNKEDFLKLLESLL